MFCKPIVTLFIVPHSQSQLRRLEPHSCRPALLASSTRGSLKRARSRLRRLDYPSSVRAESSQCLQQIFTVESTQEFIRMGSVRQRLTENRHDCNVVLVGDVRVGKTALVDRFLNNKFIEVRFLGS